MTIRFLNRERGRRSLCVILFCLIESFLFSPAVFSQGRFAQQRFMNALQTGNLEPFYDDDKMLAYARGIAQAMSDFMEENPESGKTGCSRSTLGESFYYASEKLQEAQNLANLTEFTADGRADLRLLMQDQKSRCDTPTMRMVLSGLWKLIGKPDQKPKSPEQIREEQCVSYGRKLEEVNKSIRYQQWNPPPGLKSQKKLYEEKIRELCPPSSPFRKSVPSAEASRAAEEESRARQCRSYRESLEAQNTRIQRYSGNVPSFEQKLKASYEKRVRDFCDASSAEQGSSPGTGGGQLDASAYETTMPVKVRSGPGEHYEELASLSRGAKISAVEAYTGWLKIFSKHGKPPGYIPLSAVREINPRPIETARPSLPPQAEERQAKKETPPAPAAPATSPPAANRNQSYSGVPYRYEPPPEQNQPKEQEQPKAPVSAPALSGNAVQDCDAYAAHPDDPERNGARGVEDDGVSAEKAIEVCKAAVEQNPQNGRLLFQLGRAYWAGERFEEAVETFLEAGEQGHGGALAYLGDATLYGVAGMDADPEEARKLYQRAAAAGFKPAAALSDEIVAGVKAVKLQEEQQAAGGEPNYHRPNVIKYLADGDWRSYDEFFSLGTGLVYTASLIGGVRHSCPEAIPAGTDLESLATKKVNRSFSNIFEAAAFSTQFLDRYEAGAYDETAQQGVDDGNAFAVANGCQSDKTKKFVKTAIRYF